MPETLRAFRTVSGQDERGTEDERGFAIVPLGRSEGCVWRRWLNWATGRAKVRCARKVNGRSNFGKIRGKKEEG